MVQIRKICPEDAEQVKSLIQHILNTEFAIESKAYECHDIEDPVRYYNGKRDIFLVAEKNGKIVGTVAIKADSQNTALLRRIFVSKEFRGKGYGDKLLQKAMEFCFDHNYQTVTFRGTDTMNNALRLCLKQGFEEEDIAISDEFKMCVLTKKLREKKEKS